MAPHRKRLGKVSALVGTAALSVIGLTACTATPTPRSYAQPGVPSTYNRQVHDAAYYTGADPAFPRTGKGSGGGSGE